MNKIKVTFYNDVSIVRNNDYKKASTASSAGFASGGIYFTSSNDITNGNPAHIVHGNNGFIYTLGSYIIPNSDIKTYNLTYVTGSDFNMDDNTYFISDISADPFQKTLTVTKSKIALGESFVNGINTIQDFLNNLRSKGGKPNAIKVGGKYKVWFELKDSGVFELQTEDMETGKFTNTFIDNSGKVHDDISDAFEIATENSGYFYIQAPSEITNITLTTLTKGKFYKNAQIIPSTVVDNEELKTIAKITIPNGGWDGDDKTIFEFSATINTAGNENVGASQDTFTFTLKRIESPFKFTEINNSYNVSKQVYSYISIGNTQYLTRNFDVTSLDITYNTTTKWLSFVEKENQLDSYFVINSYYLPTENEKIDFTYFDNTIINNEYYAYLTNTAKAAKIQLSGAGKWTLELQPGENNKYVHTYSFCYGTQKNPLDLFKPADTTTQTFSHWYLNDIKEPIENITFGSDLFTDYSLRLYATWKAKSNPINISGEKYSNGTVTTDMSLDTFILTATANINGTTFTWEVKEGTAYIEIDGENNTASCTFKVKQWMREDASCKIKVTAKVGGITTEEEITVKVNPVSQNIKLSPTSLSWGESDSLEPKTITVSDYKGKLSVKSSNTNVSATVLNDTVTVTPKVYGQSATITITSGETEIYSANTKEVEVTIAEKAINYYWYAGWTEPTEANIGEIINEEYPVSKTDTTTSKAGGYKNTNQGFDVNNFFAEIITNRHNIADTNRENSGQNTNYYIVVPNNMGIYSSNAPTMSALATFTLHKTFDNHIVYKSIETSRNLGSLVIY